MDREIFEYIEEVIGMRFTAIFFLFCGTEYILRTFIEQYKYHSASVFVELLPLMITTAIASLLLKTKIIEKKFGWSYLRLNAVSLGGLLVSKSVLFLQWYWIIAPEYRNVPGDMEEGFAWAVFFFVLSSIVIMLLYLIEMVFIRVLNKYRSA